jgi:DNA polymerase III subunit gamma/tau
MNKISILHAMENFVVSARKYRPSGFDEVVGQEHITTTLKNAIDNNKLAQALLFCGPRGVGKTTCARIVARLINGFEEKTESNSLNIFELDAASNNSVEDIRNLIDQVRYPPQFGKFKVYIIDEVHMLSNAAFNAFLKTLEEPPSYAIFILATTEKHKVIPTILSRCQIFDFNRIQISDIANHLKKIATHEGIPTEDEALHLISQKADGALRDALSIFDLMVTYSAGKGVTFKSTLANLHILDYDYYFNVVDALLTQNHTQPLLLFDEILKKGFDGHNFVVGLNEHLRNVLVSQDARTVDLMEVPGSVKKKYVEQAQKCPPSLLLTWLNLGTQCDINYKGSKSQRLSVELALMKMAHVGSVLHASQLNGGAADPAALKKKLV